MSPPSGSHLAPPATINDASLPTKVTSDSLLSPSCPGHQSNAQGLPENQLKEDTADNEASPFLRLAPELRNLIYDFAFAVDTEQEVDLITATPPPKALTLTCRQIYQETHYTYKQQYRKFWTDSRFFITALHKQDVQHLESNDNLDHITNLWIEGEAIWLTGQPNLFKFQWSPIREAWQNHDNLEYTFIRWNPETNTGFVMFGMHLSRLLISQLYDDERSFRMFGERGRVSAPMGSQILLLQRWLHLRR